MSETNWTPYLVAGLIALIVAAVGARATDLSDWYYALKKPPWQPPDWLFGPAWTIIFILSAIAAGLAWEYAPSSDDKIWLIFLFAANCVVNMLWSILFFSLRRPRLALLEVMFLWLSIVVLITYLWEFSPTSSLLLAPYLVWVTFAAVLNRAIVQRNPQA